MSPPPSYYEEGPEPLGGKSRASGGGHAGIRDGREPSAEPAPHVPRLPWLPVFPTGSQDPVATAEKWPLPRPFPQIAPSLRPLRRLISCASSSRPRLSAADKLPVPGLSPATRLPASPTAPRPSTGWVPRQETLSRTKHLCPSFHLCLPQAPKPLTLPASSVSLRAVHPAPSRPLMSWIPPVFLGGSNWPPVVLRPLGPQALPTLCCSGPVRSGEPVVLQLIFHQARHVFQKIQVMDHDQLGGAQGHRSECRLQTG